MVFLLSISTFALTSYSNSKTGKCCSKDIEVFETTKIPKSI